MKIEFIKKSETHYTVMIDDEQFGVCTPWLGLDCPDESRRWHFEETPIMHRFVTGVGPDPESALIDSLIRSYARAANIIKKYNKVMRHLVKFGQPPVVMSDETPSSIGDNH